MLPNTLWSLNISDVGNENLAHWQRIWHENVRYHYQTASWTEISSRFYSYLGKDS